MAGFKVSARAVLQSPAPASGHAWIAYLRCVEAHAVLTGVGFQALLSRMAREHGIPRRNLPATARLQAAVRAMAEERAALLAERELRIARRRAEKREGRRPCRDAVLASWEARHQRVGARRPAVGVWGWARLRREGLGEAVALGGGGPWPPVYRGRDGAVSVDLRHRSRLGLPAGLGAALRASLGSLARLRVVVVAGVLDADAVTALGALRRAARPWRLELWVECGEGVRGAGLPEATVRALEEDGVRVGRIGAGVLP